MKAPKHLQNIYDRGYRRGERDTHARSVWAGAEAMRQLAEWWFDNLDQWADSDRPRDHHPLWLLRAYEQEIQRWERERLADEGVPFPDWMAFKDSW